MATIRYSAMAAAVDAIASATINANPGLANGAAATGGDLDNSSNRHLFGLVSIKLASLTPATGGFVEIHCLPRLSDGTSFAERTASTLAATWIPETGSTAKEGTVTLRLLPGVFRIALVNNLGVALAITGNSVQIQTFTEEAV